MTEFNPLTEFRISHITAYYLILVIISNLVLIGALFHLRGTSSGFRKGLGLPVILGPNWKGKHFCINSVFIETAGISTELEYYLKAHIHTYPEEKSGAQKLFPINKADYDQIHKALVERKNGTGVFYEYIGDYRNDQRCFRRVAE